MLHDSAQDAIDKAGRALTSEQFRELDALIDGNFGRDTSVNLDLIDGETQKVAVNAGKLIDGPRRGLGLNSLVQRLTVVKHTRDQLFGEAPTLTAQGELRERPSGTRLRGVSGCVHLVQHLNGYHAGPTTGR